MIAWKIEALDVGSVEVEEESGFKIGGDVPIYTCVPMTSSFQKLKFRISSCRSTTYCVIMSSWVKGADC